jgi:hypothetical protein
MIFEVGDLKVTAPLDPKEGRWYIEPAWGDEIDHLYNMTARMDDYVNPTTDDSTELEKHQFMYIRLRSRSGKLAAEDA